MQARLRTGLSRWEAIVDARFDVLHEIFIPGRALQVLLQLGRVHKSLRVTPAVETKLATHVCSFEDLANMIDGMIAKAGPCVPYKEKA